MMKKVSQSNYSILLSAALPMIAAGSIMGTEGSVIKSVFQGILFGFGAVMAVAGLWAYGKSR